MTPLHQEILARFESRATQEAVALPRSNSLSYQELAARIGGTQRALQGVQAVGILATRAPEAYIGVLAAFFSGIRFVPLNPELPEARLAKIIRLAGIEQVLHGKKTSQLAAELANGLTNAPSQQGQAPAREVTFTDINTIEPDGAGLRTSPEISAAKIAYQMFTSGSTGDPKGVPISYGNLDHYITAIRAATGSDEGARFSQLFDLSFDLSMHDIFLCFANGGTLVPASDIDLMMPHAYIRKKQIDCWFSVPLIASVARRGLGEGDLHGDETTHRLRKAMFCGEALPTEYAAGFEAFLQEDAPLYNLYGPTEATIAFTARRFEDSLRDLPIVPLGQGFGGNIVAIESSETKEILPATTEGAEGELLLAGPQVFDGYDPEVPTACFLGETPRYYRSGDLVRVRGGELHHMGRTDSQIKLRGYRIELGDIEAAFRKTFPDCHAAAVVLLGDGLGAQGDTREIALAYQSDHPITDLSPLEGALPAYMRPARVMHLTQMPTNINGKIDRKTLKALSWPE